LRFSVRAKHRKMLSTENGFLKNDFPETILRRNKRSISGIILDLRVLCLKIWISVD